MLSPHQQLADTINTIEWTVQHSCSPVLFPINIKYSTFLRYLYDSKVYEPISLWMVIMVLDKISNKALENIVVAWYGNRNESYADCFPTIMPQACTLCNSTINQFFNDLHRTNDANEKRKLIATLLNHSTCECLATLKKDLKQPDWSFDKRFQWLLKELKTNSGINGKDDG